MKFAPVGGAMLKFAPGGAMLKFAPGGAMLKFAPGGGVMLEIRAQRRRTA